MVNFSYSQFKRYFININLLFIVSSLFISYAHARPFGGMTTIHVKNAIKTQIKAAIIPVLKTKKNKIQYPKLMQFSHSKRYLVLVMQGGYISLWDMKKGREIDNIKLNSLVPVSIAIDEMNKKLYLVDKKGMLYSKALVAGDHLQKVPQVKQKQYFTFIKISSDKLVLTTTNNKIVLLDKSNPAKIIASLSLKSAVQSIDVARDNNQIIVATQNKKLSVYNYSKQNNNLSLSQSWSLTNEVANVLSNNKGNAIALIFKNRKYAYTNRKGTSKFGTIQPFNKEVLAIDFVQTRLTIYTKNNTIFQQDTKTGKIFNFRRVKNTGTEQALLYKNGQFVLIPKKNNGIFIIKADSNKVIAQLISTRSGWAVIDQSGRYDGNEDAFHDVSWDADGTMLELDQFSSLYFEPGLLTKVLNNQNKMITMPGAKIQKGVYLPPTVKVAIISAKNNYSTNKKVTIKINAESNDKNNLLHDVKAYHNGKRIADQAISLHDSKKGAKEWYMDIQPLIGNNEIFVEVSGWENVLGRSKMISFFTKDIASTKTPAHFFIRSIGINQYASQDLNLNFAVSDAKKVFQTFSKSALVKKQSVVKNSKIRLLMLNKQASKKGILNMLEKTGRESNKNDWVVLFMAGHGVVENNQWYFLPQEATSSQDMTKVAQDWLSSKELMEKFIAIPSQKIVLIIDACQSGAATLDFNDFHQRRALRGLSKETGIHIITATRADQDAPEFSELGHGLFTYTLLQAMKKNRYGYFNADLFPKDGQLTVKELQDYVLKIVPVLAYQMAPKYFRVARGKDQFDERIIVTPVATSQGQDFVIFK